MLKRWVILAYSLSILSIYLSLLPPPHPSWCNLEINRSLCMCMCWPQFFHHFLPLRQDLWLKLELTDWLDCLVSKPWNPPFSVSPLLGIQVHAIIPSFCTKLLGSPTQVITLCCKYSKHFSTEPSPQPQVFMFLENSCYKFFYRGCVFFSPLLIDFLRQVLIM